MKGSSRRMSLGAAGAVVLLALPLLLACSERTAAGTASPGIDAAARAGQGRDARSAVLASLQQLQSGAFRLVYDASATTPMGALTGTVTFERKDAKAAVHFDGTLLGSHATAALIDDGAARYLCTDVIEKACYKADGSGPIAGALDDLDPERLLRDLAQKTNTSITDANPQIIAGRTGQCYDLRNSEGAGTVCLDPATKLPLLVDVTAGAPGVGLNLKAREVSGTPSDSAFQLPYPIKSLRSP